MTDNGPNTVGRFRERFRDARYILILVHGTWARESPWTMPGSYFRSFFEAHDGVVCYRFHWSGSNSLKERQLAGKRLARSVRALGRMSPAAAVFVIAHSHGGNAAFLALRDPEVATRISGLVCFNTPFIQGRFRNLGDSGAGGVIAAAVVAGMVLFSWARGQEFSAWRWRNFEVLVAAACIAVPLLKKLRRSPKLTHPCFRKLTQVACATVICR